mgnify:CR=1 FL=1
MAETLKVYMARVFSAIDVESEKLKDELERVRDRLDLGFRPVSKHRMHVTLQFFRDVEIGEIVELKEAMDDIQKDSFSTKVEGVGCFPSRDHIRVTWAGFRDEEPIRNLYKQLSQHSVEPDNTHRFKPHITLMRVKDISKEEKKKLQRTVREFQDHGFEDLEVNRVKLYRSELKEGGSRYTELHRKEL